MAASGVVKHVDKKVEDESVYEIIDKHGVALKFDSDETFRKALEIIFERDISHVLVGNRTIIIPPSRSPLFQHLSHTRVPILSAAKLPPEEINKLRRANLSLQKN